MIFSSFFFLFFLFSFLLVGAIVSCLVAGSLTTRVLSLVMIDAIGAIGSLSLSDAPLILEQSLNQRTSLISRRPRVYDTFEECLQRWSESPWAPRGAENLRLLVSRGTEEIVDPNGFISGFRFRHDPKLKSLPPYRMSEKESQEFLKRIACPVLVILATDRDPFWPDFLEKTHLELMRARVARMTGGHHPHMTNVEESVGAIETMYRECGLLNPPHSKL